MFSLRNLCALFTALLAVLVFAAPANATPPGIPSTTTARSELAELRVAADGSSSGYSRDLFPHWSTVSGSCNTRETVLRRDGTSVVTDSSCASVSGRWFSPYDGATWTAASDVDIDHIVPLANAWRTGASRWTTAQRQQFANDLSGPQLIAVTDNVNQSKSDQTPATWKPPRTTYWCTYAKMWVHTKFRWTLTVNTAEKAALTDMLNRC
ncbi:MAG TPA: HNH endonuclease family protein [Actinophytocola sp.]|uniref:HNH endonuclease family protein n=1 Tax=Actinophytocola sp. TaxID=1872138 RepID=UPI002DBDB918|nr:HNH endonuclease family protein [Actinophytocola sp.]HEU5472988.1 HNH endonuclease family protein [Actinophytocola sp.]